MLQWTIPVVGNSAFGNALKFVGKPHPFIENYFSAVHGMVKNES
jgi:hypothetical protein